MTSVNFLPMRCMAKKVCRLVHILVLVTFLSIQHIDCQSMKMVIEGCDQRHTSLSAGVSCTRRQSEGYIESPFYRNGSYEMDYRVYTYAFINNHTHTPGRVAIQFTDFDIHPNSYIEVLRDASRTDVVTKIDWMEGRPTVTSQHCCMLIRFYTKCCGSSKNHRGFKLHYWFLKPCSPFEFSCKNGACLSTSRVCNHVDNCQDGSDETQDLCFHKLPELQSWHKILLGCGVATLIIASYGYSYYKKRQRVKMAMRQQRQTTADQSTVVGPTARVNRIQPPSYSLSDSESSSLPVTLYTGSTAVYGFMPPQPTERAAAQAQLSYGSPPAYSSLFEQSPDGAIVEKNPQAGS